MKTLLAAFISVLAIGAVSYWGATVLLSVQGVELSMHGKIAMGLGVFFTMFVGVGLMALIFHSNRHGHDEAVYHLTDDVDESRPEQ